MVSGAEACDLGAGNDDAVYGGCTTRCRLAAHCGDEIVNGPEQCDSGMWGNNVTYGNRDGCTFECKHPYFCGDAIVNTDEGEQCDFGPKNGDATWRCSRECKIPLD